MVRQTFTWVDVEISQTIRRIGERIMWCIKGTRHTSRSCHCCYHNSLAEDEVVATFDTEQQANKYLRDSTLKNQNYLKKFKEKSLIFGYDSAWVEEVWQDDPPPHNPTMGKK